MLYDAYPNMSQETHRYVIQESLHQRLWVMTNAHSRVFAVRLDARFPSNYTNDGRNTELSELIMKLKQYHLYHLINVHYVWAREQNTSNNPHYHLIILLDGSRIGNGWGIRQLAENYWASILGVSCPGCIHLCEAHGQADGIMIRRPTKSEGERFHNELAAFEDAFQATLTWGSYLAKTHTKGNAPHKVKEFGCSQL